MKACAGELENFFPRVGFSRLRGRLDGILKLTLRGGAEFEAEAVDEVAGLLVGGGSRNGIIERKNG